MACDKSHKSELFSFFTKIFFVKTECSIWVLAISKTPKTLLFNKFKKHLKISNFFTFFSKFRDVRFLKQLFFQLQDIFSDFYIISKIRFFTEILRFLDTLKLPQKFKNCFNVNILVKYNKFAPQLALWFQNTHGLEQNFIL